MAERCELGHGGLVLDLGEPAAASRDLFRLSNEVVPRFSTRLGESFRRLEQLQTSFIFWLTEDLGEFELSARMHGLESERVAFYLDDQQLGAARLPRDETQVIRIGGKDRVIPKGRHKLTVSISRARGSEPAAEISWLRLGSGASKKEDFPATRREVFSEVSIGKERHASVILRPGGSLRCPVWVGRGARLLTEVGLWGQGLGELEIIVHTPSGERIVVDKLRREKSDKRDFAPLNVSLSDYEGQLVDLEFWAPHLAPGARVALARPRVTHENGVKTAAPLASRAIVVLLSGLGAAHSPPHAGENGLPFLNQLALEGTNFPGYRATTTSAPAVLASLLTGQPPYVHGLEGTDHALSREVMTVASLIESRGGRTSFFTAVPTGFSRLGFERGFGAFQEVPPQADIPEKEVIQLAQNWLTKHLSHEGPLLSILQLRGAHPPFDISMDAAVELAPAEYGGELSPRRAAIQLADIRELRQAAHREMPGEDWERLSALSKAALLKQNAALGQLIAWLRERDAYDDTLFVVLGDVGAGERPLIPYDHKAPLSEEYLAVPLVIKFPQGFARAMHVPGRFAPRDVTQTVLSSLGISEVLAKDAIDLSASDAEDRVKIRPHIAYRDHAYSLVYEGTRLFGSDGNPPKLCEPSLDPQCLDDRAGQQIMKSRALWLYLWSELSAPLSRSRLGEEIAEDLEFENALTVWGERR
jgi:hypothetical protein